MDANLTVVTKNTIYTCWLTMTSRQIDCIKIVAFLAMIADHANTAFSLHNGWLMLIGRMAFPLFALIWGINQARHPEIKQSSLNRLWLWVLIAQPCYYLVVMNAGTAFWQLNILFTFAVAGQSLKWFRNGVAIKHVMAIILVMAYLPLSLTSYFIFGLLLLWCSRWLFMSKNSGRVLILWCLIVILLNIHILAIVAFGGLVLTIVVWAIFGGLKSEGRILPKNFFLYGYAAHLLILGGVMFIVSTGPFWAVRCLPDALRLNPKHPAEGIHGSEEFSARSAENSPASHSDVLWPYSQYASCA